MSVVKSVRSTSWLLLAVWVVMSTPQRASAVEPVALAAQWGSLGSGPGQFHWPAQMAIDSDGHLLVVDHGNNRVQKFTTDGKYLGEWSVYGDTPLAHPFGLTIAGDGTIYVLTDQRVRKFTPSGSLIQLWGSWGACDGQFMSPTAIALDNSGNAYVGDNTNNGGRVEKFTDSGLFITKWGSWSTTCDPGEEWTGPNIRVGGLLMTDSGNLLVGDYDTNAVREYTTTGDLVTQWSCSNPGSMAKDAGGNVYIAGDATDKVHVFSSAGTPLYEFGSHGTGDGQFDFVAGVAVDAAGDIFVADLNNHRIQKFARNAATAAKTSSWGTIKYRYR